MFALYYVYMPRINKALDEVSSDWKYHPLSSARNRLPYELSPYGMARLIDWIVPSCSLPKGVTGVNTPN